MRVVWVMMSWKMAWERDEYWFILVACVAPHNTVSHDKATSAIDDKNESDHYTAIVGGGGARRGKRHGPSPAMHRAERGPGAERRTATERHKFPASSRRATSVNESTACLDKPST
jgi:hypothetical protein